MVFEIIQIPRDDEGVRLYVGQYKAFRLLSLKVAPEMFGSTYEREIAFAEETWYSRLASPLSNTFMAFQANEVVGLITVVGPLPFRPEEKPPTGNPWNSFDGASAEDKGYSHFRINGMFTAPEVRGQGIAKELMKRGIQIGVREAKLSNKEYIGSVVVDSDNPPAVSLYTKFGFITTKGTPRYPGSLRTVLLMEYSPDAHALALIQDMP